MEKPHDCEYAEYNDGHVDCGMTAGGGADGKVWTYLCQLCSKDKEITRLREDAERWKKRATECVGVGTIIMFEEEDAARGEGEGQHE